MKRALLAVLLVPAAASAQAVNDYPTEARVEYVLACMATNGESPDALRRCSCSIDNIATVLPYERYVAAETMMDTVTADLRRAEAEAEILCF